VRYLSLFSGIEAASVAWEPLGWEPVAFAEIEKGPCRVLSKRWPGVSNLGDVTQVTEWDVMGLGHIDAVIFGSPCQDLSVAGKQKGLTGERSGLFHVGLDIARWARPRWVLWENVPGALSSCAGRDFATVVGAMAGCEVAVPPKGWGNEGAVVGQEAMVEWSTLDAQWFGVAQRRRRVFALADFGDWRSRPPVLLEPESLRGDSAPSRSAGQGATGSAEAGAGVGGVLPGVAMCRNAGGVNRLDAESQTLVAFEPRWFTRDNKTGGAPSGTVMLTAAAGEGDSSPVIAFHHNAQVDQMNFDPHTTACLTTSQQAAVCFTSKDYGADAINDVAPTLRAMGHAGSHANGGGQLAVCLTGQVTHALNTCNNGKGSSEDGTGRGTPIVAHGPSVRRLTEIECERLQGFPDGHTDAGLSSGARYKALGNSMAVPVIRWIGRQIEKASA